MGLVDKFKCELGKAHLKPKDLVVPIAGAAAAALAIHSGAEVGDYFYNASHNSYVVGTSQATGTFLGGAPILIPAVLAYNYSLLKETGERYNKWAVGKLFGIIGAIGLTSFALKIAVSGYLISEGQDPQFVSRAYDLSTIPLKASLANLAFFETVRSIRKSKQ